MISATLGRPQARPSAATVFTCRAAKRVSDGDNQLMCKPTGRKGITSVLAMMYMVLFSTLALGFFAASTMNSQIAKNERNEMQAQDAAESGMQFARYQLGL